MKKYYTELADSIRGRETTIGVVGLGYVGLPLLKLILDSGFKAVGFDIDETKIVGLSKGELLI